MIEEKQLVKAVVMNDTVIIAGLLKGRVNVELKDEDRRTPLMLAVYRSNTAAARLLIAAGANVNAQDKLLNSPFLYAAASGCEEIVRLSMQHGADYKVLNRYGGTALIPACERGHLAVVAALLEDKSFPVDHVNNLGWTALLEAIILGNGGPQYETVVQMLVTAGCDVNIADKEGVTPLQHAVYRGFREIAWRLMQAGAK
ncbi:ankyrin repeat domain-containing protein [uncultured Chitinophaga sp.]|uniref:ankyrin repeat domain-containing protein n=1 Tax=uncultured Chitinophaga sp. TaxID=339340 RepID=UPI0025F42F9A|nr:ankyrin repeat domain-containing protein [uncultured Chitinophaga sp.]